MRQTQKDRTVALLGMGTLGITEHHAKALLRLGATIHRLAEAQCNGDWPADNGVRPTVECQKCGSFWARAALRKTRDNACPDCCAAEDAQKLASIYGLKAVCGGDPRGSVLTLYPAGAKQGDIDSGRERGVYVY